MDKLDPSKGKGRKLSLISKTWERCRSIGSGKRSSSSASTISKSKSWPHYLDLDEVTYGFERKVAPEGCFSVYVGPEKQRFAIKTKYANHPLFKMLLEEAEMEYGFSNEGPIALPCPVDLFHWVLFEMDIEARPRGCNFAKRYTSYQLLGSPRKFA